MSSHLQVAVVIDLVKSRQIAERRSAQVQIETAFALVNSLVIPVQPLEATVGDEFQAVYESVPAALEATLLARLALPAGIDCRFGMASGDLWSVGSGATGPLQDGPGWWLAREAINEAHVREDARTPSLRSWYRSDDAKYPEAVVNAHLLVRDHVVGGMSDRARRITLGTFRGQSQAELAASEHISQSAVSQSLRRSGGASLVSSLELFTAGVA
ncbi:SatD family protein [Subtercola sp. PAMC28395]|uniref:SatD family protein n=1 Tax=Subtercola sp. PAMC28395 TaxID=2846775 RepID=UPI001C0DB7D8|nr:SatD family protein [Subtercola sp. PAMC28395]QWT23451.1 SatD family protein [Subtercola sp. PAMC28395]